MAIRPRILRLKSRLRVLPAIAAALLLHAHAHAAPPTLDTILYGASYYNE